MLAKMKVFCVMLAMLEVAPIAAIKHPSVLVEVGAHHFHEQSGSLVRHDIRGFEDAIAVGDRVRLTEDKPLWETPAKMGELGTVTQANSQGMALVLFDGRRAGVHVNFRNLEKLKAPAQESIRRAAQPKHNNASAVGNVTTADGIVVDDFTSNVSAGLMIAILCISLGGLIWTQRSRLQESSRTEIIATSCVLIYIALTITVDVLIRRFHQQGDKNSFQFSPAVMTTLIEIGKFVFMIIGALADWENTRNCRAIDFGKTMLLMMIPAACFVALNLGRYAALSGADLDQYRVWRCTDIIWVAMLWFSMFRKKPLQHQVAGICLVFLSCLMMHHQNQKFSGSVQTSPTAILTILGIAFVSSLGLVMNEFGLKASSELSLFVQSLALYFLTSVLNSVVVVATVPMSQIFQGIHAPQVSLIVIDVFLGLSVACVLKYANAMVKQLASGWLAPLEPLVGHFIVGTPVTPTMVFATVFAGAGSIIYRLPEDKKDEKKAPETEVAQGGANKIG